MNVLSPCNRGWRHPSEQTMTITQLALTITLMHPGVDCAIVGIKNPAQIEEAAGAMGKTIDIRDWHDARMLMQDVEAG